MKTFKTIIALLLPGAVVLAQPGGSRQLGKAGEWVNTLKAVEVNGKIYTIEKSGALLVTDPATGTWKQIGKPDYQNTKFIFAGSNTIFTIDEGGTLYNINPADGAWKTIGEAGAWTGTIAGTILNGKLYSIEKSGILSAADLGNGTRVQIGKPEFANMVRMWAANGKLYAHEGSGTLFEVDLTDGTYRQIGATEGWADTMMGVVINNMLYTIESSGTLYETDLTNGKWKQIGNSEYQNTLFMTGGGTKIHTIADTGSLFEIAIQ